VITAVYRQYLEIKSIKDLKESFKPSGNYLLEIVDKRDFQLNRFFYKQIGKKYRWIDRLNWNDLDWFKYVSNEKLITFILKKDNDLVGFFELIYSKDKNDGEIAYLGILEEYIGKKIGGYLLSEAIKKCFSLGLKRIWLHTCSLDHKNALKNYLSRGMNIFKSETLNM